MGGLSQVTGNFFKSPRSRGKKGHFGKHRPPNFFFLKVPWEKSFDFFWIKTFGKKKKKTTRGIPFEILSKSKGKLGSKKKFWGKKNYLGNRGKTWGGFSPFSQLLEMGIWKKLANSKAKLAKIPKRLSEGENPQKDYPFNSPKSGEFQKAIFS